MSHDKLFPEVKITETIPEGFKDVSYINDEFPSWWNEEKDLTLYITNVEGKGVKYQVEPNQANDDADWLFTDNWSEALEFIKNFKSEE